ncbi:MAG: M18 family aminopeptidase [Bacteroidales bacterium]|nr:M18 family aminopeptidase [Bacteroidales bacterium]
MIDRLINFLEQSPVNFLAVKTITTQLEEAGFKRLDPTLPMNGVKAGDKVYVTKNDSAVFAFHLGKEKLSEAGFHIICAHSDSPTFRIKPNAEMLRGGMLSLNTELYGGAIMSTWFDRPLSLAGRVILRTNDVMTPESRLLHIRRPLLVIPNLAIHFNRQVNDGVKLSKQKDMLPLMAIGTGEIATGKVLLNVIATELNVKVEDIIDFDLYLYDTTPGCRVGLHNEFISAGRLDDLSMAHAALEALLMGASEKPKRTRIMAIFDNEETGSQTKQGAGSPFLMNLIQRLVMAQGDDMDGFHRAVEQAFMVSADNAHAWHPNYTDKYDPTNHPVLGGGPVIKFNAAQKYASDAVSSAVFESVCKAAGVPCQKFVNHSDVAGGSTLGNILASSLPMRGVDMGNGVLSMHSVRELASCADHEYCIKAFRKFYEL